MSEVVGKSKTAERKARRKASQQQRNEEKNKAIEMANKAIESTNIPSRFQKIIPSPRFVPPIILSDEDRSLGVYALVDYENAIKDFPLGYDMDLFQTDLVAALRRRSGKDYRLLGLYGAGTFSVFKRVQNYYALKRNRSRIFDIQSRYAECTSCGKELTFGPKVTFERTSDRACDLISQEMSSYPTRIGHRQGMNCNVLVITADYDLGSAMRTLKERGVTVMLAFTGGSTSDYMRQSATGNMVLNFQQEVFP